MEFVVNEWLPEYFKPGATQQEKQLLQTFLTTFYEKNDKLYVRNPCMFLTKIYRYADSLKNYNSSQVLRSFIDLVIKDSNRCCQITDVDTEVLPSITLAKLSVGNFASDQYLFEAAIKTDSKIIVTTDTRLRDQMIDDPDFKVVLLETFLSTYTV